MSANSNPTGRDGLVVTIPATLAKRLRDGVSSGDLLARAETSRTCRPTSRPPRASSGSTTSAPRRTACATRSSWWRDWRTPSPTTRQTPPSASRSHSSCSSSSASTSSSGGSMRELQDLRAHPGEAAMQKAEDEVEDWRALVLQLNEIEPPR